MPSIFTRRTRDYFQGPDGEQYDKFSTKNKPTKTMFRRLFEAVGFMNESSDTAQTDVQGFVQLNTDSEASAKNSTVSANGFAKVVQAHHLPHLIEDANVDNPDGAGDVNNAFSVRKISTGYGRTGGSGDTYILKNTMGISAHVDLDFVSVTQSAAGANVELGFHSANFDTKVGATSTVSTINANINSLKKGFVGEIKMYSFLNESLGQVNCEFDGQGVGRAAGSHGATGQWAGWVVLMGQSAGVLKGSPYNSPDEIIDRITNGAYIVDTSQSYPSGISTAVTAENAGFKSVGSNEVSLTTNQTPIREHYHTLSGSNVTGNAKISIGGGIHSHYIGASFTSDSGPDTVLRTGGNTGAYTDIEWIRTDVVTSGGGSQKSGQPGFNASPDGDAGMLDIISHTHTYTFSGSTDNASDVNSDPHPNRPQSFIVCYAMYIGTTGSPN